MALDEICLPVTPASRSGRRTGLAGPADAGTPTDHDLMLAVRDGQLEALGELFRRHSGPLFGFLKRHTGQFAAAEDILQNVFLRMLRYRHTYRNDGSFAPWMYRLARHSAADHCRKMPAVPAEAENLLHLEDARPHAAQRASESDDRDLLHRALARLDADDREILLLSRIKELSYAEIAGILDCSVGAAKVRAHRALAQLRAVYLSLQKPSLP